MKKLIALGILILSMSAISQTVDPFSPDFTQAKKIAGMSLVFNEEFNYSGKPDSTIWNYEKGYVRNQELQWYQSENANCLDGRLLIEAKKTDFENPNFHTNSKNWKTNRKRVAYTSACILTKNKKTWKFGRFEIRARIDTAMGAWPAIWTLGIENRWPDCGEIDILEFYRPKNIPSILANTAWGSSKQSSGEWNSAIHPISNFNQSDNDWARKYHVWRMDWFEDSIKLYIDDILLNTTDLSNTLNPDGTNPFLQAHYLLLNLALGQNGGNPAQSKFPITFEVDYVRVYQRNN